MSLSQADQYHLSVKTDFSPLTEHAQIKVHFFLPTQLAENSDITHPDSFYQNLLQKQLVTSTTEPSITAVEHALLILKQTAYARAADNVRRYRKALSHFITDSRILLVNAQLSELTQFDDIIDSFIRLHDNETLLGDGRLYNLAKQQIIYYYFQALLRQQKHQGHDLKITSLINKYLDLAQTMQIQLNNESEQGREKLLNKLHLGRKIIHSPYKVTRKKLKNGEVAQQLIFGLAAALAMAFATGVAFATQQAFGNFSTPFFFSLVLSYIFKDRLKELGRQYLLDTFSKSYFQHQYRFFQGTRRHEIANVKESVYQQLHDKLPDHIHTIFKRLFTSEQMGKQHWVYQRRYFFSEYKRQNHNEKFIDELTINLSKTLRSLPKIISQHYSIDGTNTRMSTVHKVHHIHLLVSVTSQLNTEYHQYRIVSSRKGIHGVYRLNINNLYN
ncbi:hypothetical protein [Shewanella maritima]|uniref:hypothetical protein n=1 Tax=Shewanella maritima TaxID=2520507 RepID=UPI0037366760